LRLNNFISENSKSTRQEEARFSLKKCGAYSYNSLVEEAIARYQRATVQDFRSEVGATKRRMRSVIASKSHDSFSITESKMPYVEHTIISLLKWDIFKYVTHNDQIRLRKEFHRKEGAAYVVACLLAGRRPVYAGDRFVLWSSDGNIRDFLDVMAEFFDRRVHSGDNREQNSGTIANQCRRFLSPKEKFSIAFQNECLRAVSQSSLQTIKAMENTTDEPNYYLLQGLGELQRKMHHSLTRGEAVRTPERGVFVVDYEQFDRLAAGHQLPGFSGIVRRIERDGFLRIVNSDEDQEKTEIAFRLHRRLAPALECSPRGAYERVRLDPKLLLRLLLQVEPISPREWAQSIYDGLTGRDARQRSFEI
ncbi:MAG: hypothetical protein AAFY98_12455, partial [Verrucomicrobiota bacterium]